MYTCSAERTRQVLCELLSGMDSEVIVSLLRDAVEKYTRGEETGWRDGSGEIHAARRRGVHTRPELETKAVKGKLAVRPQS